MPRYLSIEREAFISDSMSFFFPLSSVAGPSRKLEFRRKNFVLPGLSPKSDYKG